MVDPEPISIIGGGLAGLALGIGLRRAEIPAIIWEAGSYPRHKVCGEFISGAGQATLGRLGLVEALTLAGAITARTSAFFGTQMRTPARPLPVPGLCMSRFVLDTVLAKRFRDLGGELHEKSTQQTTDLDEGIVLATGRRAEAPNGGWRW